LTADIEKIAASIERSADTKLIEGSAPLWVVTGGGPGRLAGAI
jgi:hypothetical protein